MSHLIAPNAYYRDLLLNYGNGGRRIELPSDTRVNFERAMQFHHDQKSEMQQLRGTVQGMQEQILKLQEEGAHARRVIGRLRSDNDHYRFVDSLLAPRRATEADNEARPKKEHIISSTSVGNHAAPSSNGPGRVRGVQHVQEAEQARGAHEPVGDEAGGQSATPTDADVDRPADEHAAP